LFDRNDGKLVTIDGHVNSELAASGMSKAFTRESDDGPDLPAPVRPIAALPPGVKNYVTAAGARKLRDELAGLINMERPRPASLDQRIMQLEAALSSAVVVPVPEKPWDEVRFGATVTVRDPSGAEERYRIVGIDEVDVDRDWVSWRSPIATALLNARMGQRVRFRVPAGERQLEIVAIAYE
jgi:transcription elongation factor GreB